MIRTFSSTEVEPFGRGVEFGRAHAAEIKDNITLYQNLFDQIAGHRYDARHAGTAAIIATRAFAPALYAEIIGIAQGAGVEASLIGMLNARTEILAAVNASAKGECSSVIQLFTGRRAPIAVQTWDWHAALQNGWFVWTIPHADGSFTKTMTEFGIVGKVGLNTRGLGLLFTILHHAQDGRRMGVPVHVVARHVLDTAGQVDEARRIAAGADVVASTSLNIVSADGATSSALTLELNPGEAAVVKPDAKGTLIHTNHFLAAHLKAFDTGPASSPDTLSRYDLLTRKLAAIQDPDTRQVLAAMANHDGGDGAVCCHHDPQAPVHLRYETLATVVLDFVEMDLKVHAGGPCTHPLLSAA